METCPYWESYGTQQRYILLIGSFVSGEFKTSCIFLFLWFKKRSPTNLQSSLVTGAEVCIGASAAALSLLILCLCEELQWNTEQA